MNVFDLRNRVLDDYHRYVESFLNIRDQRIQDFVDAELRRGILWALPGLRLFRPGMPCQPRRGRLQPLIHPSSFL